MCLFLSDLDRIADVVRKNFSVTFEENKIEEGDVASFGYMSVHYECALGDRYSGARYDTIKNIRFELQVRTIVMDAWANVSHHLAYKGVASIPRSLRRDFHALSGLFYVADQHFEMFSREVYELQREIQSGFPDVTDSDIELSRDVLTRLLQKRYPDREHSDDITVSEVAEELLAQGYNTLAKVESLIDRTEDAVLRFEEENRPGRTGELRYADVGMLRIALNLDDRTYMEGVGPAVVERYDAYRLFIKTPRGF